MSYFEIFCDVLRHQLTTMQNFTEIVAGEPIRRALNARGVAKYSNVEYVKSYIPETVQDDFG